MEPIDPPHTLGPGVKFTYRHIVATTSCSPVTAINEAALQTSAFPHGISSLAPLFLVVYLKPLCATKAFERLSYTRLAGI